MKWDEHVTVLVPTTAKLDSVLHQTTLKCFASETTLFIKQLSSRLLDARLKHLPEIVALGFWLRKVIRYSPAIDDRGVRKPLGIVVHFTPTNVDTMFVYSWISSLLLGNINIVRISTSDSQYQETLLAELNDLLALPDFESIKQRNCFIRYDKNSAVTSELSKSADARVIWGGDESVKQIKSNESKPRARDISFADRYSATIINGNALKGDKLSDVSQHLWRDVKPYSQQACSSPRLIFWLGAKTHQAAFFTELDKLALMESAPMTLSNEQLVFRQYIKALSGGASENFERICIVNTPQFTSDLLAVHSGNYCFVLTQLDSLASVNDLLDTKCQTLSYYGFDKEVLIKLAEDLSITGIDRIVPIGQALDFDFHWDGYNLIESFSRYVKVL